MQRRSKQNEREDKDSKAGDAFSCHPVEQWIVPNAKTFTAQTRYVQYSTAVVLSTILVHYTVHLSNCPYFCMHVKISSERCSDEQRLSVRALLFCYLHSRCDLENPAVDSIAVCIGLDSLGRKSFNGFNVEIEVRGSLYQIRCISRTKALTLAR